MNGHAKDSRPIGNPNPILLDLSKVIMLPLLRLSQLRGHSAR